MAFPKYNKDPDARLDYLFDFAAQTNGNGGASEVLDYLAVDETIISATVTSSAPLELVVDAFSIVNLGKSVLAWIRGGVEWTSYIVTVHIVTSDGREDDRSITIYCKHL